MEIAEARAIVRDLDGHFALIEVEQGGCGRCHEKGGCGGQHLTQMLCTTPKIYKVQNRGGVAVGDRVIVAIGGRAVRDGANLLYGIPLVGVFAGAGVGMYVGGDPAAMLGALLGLSAAWCIVRLKNRLMLENSHFQPYIIVDRDLRV